MLENLSDKACLEKFQILKEFLGFRANQIWSQMTLGLQQSQKVPNEQALYKAINRHLKPRYVSFHPHYRVKPRCLDRGLCQVG